MTNQMQQKQRPYWTYKVMELSEVQINVPSCGSAYKIGKKFQADVGGKNQSQLLNSWSPYQVFMTTTET